MSDLTNAAANLLVNGMPEYRGCKPVMSMTFGTAFLAALTFTALGFIIGIAAT